MGNPPLMHDVWIYLSEHYLDKADISCLSKTCRSIRGAVFHLLFRRLVFHGITTTGQTSLRAFLNHLLYTSRRVDFLDENPYLTRFIREIEFRNWTLLSQKLAYLRAAELRRHNRHVFVDTTTANTKSISDGVLTDAKGIFRRLMSVTDNFLSLKSLTFGEEEILEESETTISALNTAFTQPLVKDEYGFLSFMIELRIDRELDGHPSRIAYLGSGEAPSASFMLDLIRCNFFPIVAAIIPPSIMPMLHPWDYSRFTSLQRLGLCLTPTLEQTVRAQHQVRKFLKLSPHLQVVEIVHTQFNSQPWLKMPSHNLVLLRSFSGSFSLFTQLRYPIHTLRLRDAECGSLHMLLSDVPDTSHESLQTLDLRDIPAAPTIEDLNSVAKTWPNLLHLILTDKGIRMKETNEVCLSFRLCSMHNVNHDQVCIIECIGLALPFSRLEIMSIYAPGAARRPLPKTAGAIFDHRCHKSLQEINFPGHGSVVWNATKGWMFQANPPLYDDEIAEVDNPRLEKYMEECLSV